MISKAMSQWIAMWQQVTLKLEELCEAFGSTRSVEEEDENEQEMVPRLTKLYRKLKRFSKHKGNYADRENILSLEKSYFN
jgi:hypothetical protein